MNKKANQPMIVRSMRISEITALLPASGPLLAQYGLSCFGCAANALENLEEGCRGHGFTEEDIDDLVKDLNEMMKDRPERPQHLTITKLAAQQLGEIAAAEGKAGQGLLVGVDEFGGFCMEFVEGDPADVQLFQNKEVPAVRVFATSITLGRIGGATIDLRDGRFKLDLPEDKAGCACTDGGTCGCTKS